METAILKIGSLSRPTRLPVQIAEALRKEISEGRLKVGDRLPTEHYLAEHFGVSRNVVREAIAQLRSEGLVHSKQGLGTIVSSGEADAPFVLDAASLSYDQVYEFRLGVEVRSAELASRRASEAQIEALYRSVDLMRDAQRWETEGVDLDLEFHIAIAQATGNPLIVNTIRFIATKMRATIMETRKRSGSAIGEVKRLTVKEHAAICDGIRSRNPEAAAGAMTIHIQNAAHRLGYDMSEDRDSWSDHEE